MKIQIVRPPRKFRVGLKPGITLKDCASILLRPSEQITCRTSSGAAFDITRKSWGFYATGSLNQRLPAHRLRPALVSSKEGKYFLLLVEKGKEKCFKTYARKERLKLLLWLDSFKSQNTLQKR